MPLLTKVEFRGRTAIRLKEIEGTTDLKVGERADPMRTRLAVAQIQRFYQEKGYDLAAVMLLEGGNPGDTKIVIEIFEGTQYKVRNVVIEGNTKIKTETLRQDLELHSGKPFALNVREANKNRMLVKYRELGLIDCGSMSNHALPTSSAWWTSCTRLRKASRVAWAS